MEKETRTKQKGYYLTVIDEDTPYNKYGYPNRQIYLGDDEEEVSIVIEMMNMLFYCDIEIDPYGDIVFNGYYTKNKYDQFAKKISKNERIMIYTANKSGISFDVGDIASMTLKYWILFFQIKFTNAILTHYPSDIEYFETHF